MIDERNSEYLPIRIGAVVVRQVLFTYALPVQDLFGTMAIPLRIWPWPFLGGFVFFLGLEAQKWIIRRWRASKPAQAA
jgi:hypothetical protein